MTTIAYDGKKLASDSRAVAGWICQGETVKIKETENGYYGVAGYLIDFEPIVNAFESLISQGIFDNSGNHVKHDEHYIFEAIEVTGSQVLFIPFYDHANPVMIMVDDKGCLRTEKHQVPTAIGSGSPFAMGAMLAGKSADEAVQIASMLDTGTDSNVTCIDIEEEHKKEEEALQLNEVFTAVLKEGSYKKAAKVLDMPKEEVERLCQGALAEE